MVEVGSMSVKGVFDASKIYGGLSSIINKFKSTGMESKNLNVEFLRMKGSMLGMAAAAGVTGGSLLAMLVKAVMTSPLLAGALAKLKIAFMLFGNTIAKYVAPIIENMVKLVNWLHGGFKKLPTSVQSSIVKFIIYGGIILSILSTIGLLIVGLGMVKGALIALGGAAILTKLGMITTAIAGSTAAMVLLGSAAGIVLGILGVMAMDKLGILDWFSDLGEGFRTASGHAALFRDLLMVILGGFAVWGQATIDIAKGDFTFGRTKAAIGEMREMGERLKKGDYSEVSSTSISLPEKASIGTQTNTVNMDFNGANFQVAGGPDGLQDWLSQLETIQAENLQVTAP